MGIPRRIDRYVVGEFFFSFLVAFLFFFFLFFVNQLLVMAEQIFSKKVPFWDVLLFILYSLPSIVALSFPFGSLVGALMAVGRLSSDNEILALKASGVALGRILLPLLLAGAVLSAVSFVMNDYFLPLGNIRLGQIYRKILYTNPGVELEPYSVKRYDDTVIVTGAIEGGRIQDVLIIDRDEKKQKRIITARQAALEQSRAQRGVAGLRLEEVFTQLPADSGSDRFEYTTARSMLYNLLLRNISATFINPGPREMSSVDVWREMRVMRGKLAETRREERFKGDRALYQVAMELRMVRDMQAQSAALAAERLPLMQEQLRVFRRSRERHITDRNLQLYELEFQKKFSIPITCLVFIVFAFPVGLYARRSGRAVGFGVGLFMAAFYWGLLFVGHSLGIRLDVPAAVAMWFPNVLILAAGGLLLVRRLRR